MRAGIGAFIDITGSYTISGAAARHLIATGAGAIIKAQASATITLSGTPAFATAFAVAEELGEVRFNSGAVSFSGSAKGARYSSTLNGLVSSNGGGASYFPGSSAGSTATGGLYA